MKFLAAWVLNAIALLLVANFVPDINMHRLDVALIAAVVIGFVNMFIKPLLVVFTLPVTLLTLGLFIFVINGVLFWGVAHYLEGFNVDTIIAGIIGAFAYSVCSWLLTKLLIKKK